MNDSPSESWIAYWQPRPKVRVRLFCFPYAGGGASIYRSWRDNLPPEIEICPVQLPGREKRIGDPTFTRLDNLITTLVDALLPYLDMPFAFFGHSLGGLIGFELTRFLSQYSLVKPIRLFVSGCRAPQFPLRHKLVHDLPETQLFEHLHSLGGIPQIILENVEMMQILLPTLRADFELLETYNYTVGQPLDCPISVFGAVDDPQVSRDEILGWQEQSRPSIVLRMFTGGHFFLHKSRVALWEAIVKDLATENVER